ncbi:SpoIIE family protein phosphatase [Candidatus Amoebophilus asiaticus]|nr:SpoIIE family protein phosphatase [Candidatus Amoebophilus asiaticus]
MNITSAQMNNMKLKHVLIVFFLLILKSQGLFAQKVKFEHFTLSEGLSQSTVNCILQDSKGFLWIGTQDGLNKYDGYGFTVYKPDPEDPKSLSNGFIQCIYEDREGIIWIGTWHGGLNRFDSKTEKFTRFVFDQKDKNSLSNNQIKCIYGDESTLWIGTWGGGLNKFDIKTNTFTHYVRKATDSKSISSNWIRCILKDSKNNLWIGTREGGLNKYQPKTQTFERYYHDKYDTNSISHNEILCIFEDSRKSLWFGTNGGGLNKFIAEEKKFIHFKQKLQNPNSLNNNFIKSLEEDGKGNIWIGTYEGLNSYDPSTNEFIQYLNDPTEITSITGNDIICLYKDRNGILWIGTSGDGLNKYDYYRQRFNHIKHEVANTNSLRNNDVNAIYEARNGILWIGTNGGGLDKYEPDSKKFTHFGVDKKNQHSLSSIFVKCIQEDKAGNVWIGTFAGGLNLFDPKTNQFTHFYHNPDDENSIGSNNIKCLFIDSKNNLWIGTFGSGLNMLDLNDEISSDMKITHYKAVEGNRKTISNNFITGITEDKNGHIWVATLEGLNKLDRNTNVFHQFKHNPANTNTISSSSNTCVYSDSKGILWVGTHGSGLNKYDPATNIFFNYTSKHGLPNDVINGILEDQDHNLWLSTNKGISKLNVQTMNFKNYDERDGLQSNEFNQGAFHKGLKDRVYFGGINGFNFFYPGSIKNNTFKPPISIIRFKIFDKDAKLDKSIKYTKNLTLTYHQNFFSFEFTAMNFTIPEKNQYAYKMEGFDKDWIYCGTRRYASYTNLDPGTYTFKVKGSNNDGVWNDEGTSLSISIRPPFWKTWWFYTLLVISMIVTIVTYIKMRERNLRARQKQLEKKVEKRTEELRGTNDQLQLTNLELEKLSLVASKTDNGVLIANSKGEVEWINEGFTRMSGFTLEELKEKKGRTMSEISHNPKFDAVLDDCVTHKKSIIYESLNTNKEGKKIWVSTMLTPIFDEKNELKKFIAIDADISERKKAEEIITDKNTQLAQKNKDITDSINYARKIQDAIMLPKEEIYQLIPNIFICYQPKDIVSGDFYWFYEVKNGKDHDSKFIVAAVDCTGHGVPGAFMSMIGNNLLNKIIIEQKITEPDEILNNLHEGVSFALRQDQADSETKDGMDIVICNVDIKNRNVQYAGAHRPLYIIRNNTREDPFTEIKADRVGIGGGTASGKRTFNNHLIDLDEGDTIYLFSDGYVDQFGGEKNKKFMSRRFKEMLMSIRDKNMRDQQKMVEKEIQEWKGNHEQTDDILVIGIRV